MIAMGAYAACKPSDLSDRLAKTVLRGPMQHSCLLERQFKSASPEMGLQAASGTRSTRASNVRALSVIVDPTLFV